MASMKAVVTQIVGLDQVVLSFEAPVSVGIAPGQAVSCAGASRTAAKFCGGRNSVYSLVVVLAGRRMREWLDVVKLLSGARDASQLVTQKVYHKLGGGGLFEFGSVPLPGSFQISPKLEEHDGCLHLVQSVTFTLFHGGFNVIEARLRLLRSFLLSPRSRSTSIRINKSGPKPSPMQCREVISEPFDKIAFDLVGPLPRGKGGYTHTFYALPSFTFARGHSLRTGLAAEVANAMMNIFSCIGLPSALITDQGKNFIGKLIASLCQLFGIHKLQMTAYHPQSNGTLERVHGVLKPIIAKAIDKGIGWVEVLPLALFAIRQLPNRDTGFSPSDLVYGKKFHGPLDIIYEGWSNAELKTFDVCTWVQNLRERLTLFQDIAFATDKSTSEKRCNKQNKSRKLRELPVGTKVFLRISGMRSVLTAAWEGPYTVLHKLSGVTYRII